MAKVFLTVEDNSAPTLRPTLKRNHTPIDLTGASAILIIQNENTGTITNTGHQACTIADADNGIIQYGIEATDFPTPGNYLAEVKVTYSDSTVEIIYEQLQIIVRQKIPV